MASLTIIPAGQPVPPVSAAPKPAFDLNESVGRNAARHGVDPRLIHAIVGQESGGNQGVTSSKGARGIMQLMPGTAAELGVDINDPEQNIEGGTRYIKQMLDRYSGDVVKATAAYNAGPGNVDKYNGVPPFRETVDYVKNISAALMGPQPQLAMAPVGPESPASLASSSNSVGMQGQPTQAAAPYTTKSGLTIVPPGVKVPPSGVVNPANVPDATVPAPPAPPEEPGMLADAWQGVKSGLAGEGSLYHAALQGGQNTATLEWAEEQAKRSKPRTGIERFAPSSTVLSEQGYAAANLPLPPLDEAVPPLAPPPAQPVGRAGQTTEFIAGLIPELPLMVGAGAAMPGPAPVKGAAAFAAPAYLKGVLRGDTLGEQALHTGEAAALGAAAGGLSYIPSRALRAAGGATLFGGASQVSEGPHVPTYQDVLSAGVGTLAGLPKAPVRPVEPPPLPQGDAVPLLPMREPPQGIPDLRGDVIRGQDLRGQSGPPIDIPPGTRQIEGANPAQRQIPDLRSQVIQGEAPLDRSLAVPQESPQPRRDITRNPTAVSPEVLPLTGPPELAPGPYLPGGEPLIGYRGARTSDRATAQTAEPLPPAPPKPQPAAPETSHRDLATQYREADALVDQLNASFSKSRNKNAVATQLRDAIERRDAIAVQMKEARNAAPEGVQPQNSVEQYPRNEARGPSAEPERSSGNEPVQQEPPQAAEPTPPPAREVENKYARAGTTVDGRVVRKDVPNTSSIAASLSDYDVLPGIRSVPMSEFSESKPYSADGVRRVNKLAEEIKASGEINPLIVVLDAEAGPYVLEGANRLDALQKLGAKELPAMVVIDRSESTGIPREVGGQVEPPRGRVQGEESTVQNNAFIPAIVPEMMEALGKSTSNIRDSITNVKEGRIDYTNDADYFTFEFDGKVYEAPLTVKTGKGASESPFLDSDPNSLGNRKVALDRLLGQQAKEIGDASRMQDVRENARPTEAQGQSAPQAESAGAPKAENAGNAPREGARTADIVTVWDDRSVLGKPNSHKTWADYDNWLTNQPDRFIIETLRDQTRNEITRLVEESQGLRPRLNESGQRMARVNVASVYQEAHRRGLKVPQSDILNAYIGRVDTSSQIKQLSGTIAADVPKANFGKRTVDVKPTRNPDEMSASEINKELDKLDKQSSSVTDALIAAGRGTEKAWDTLKLNDPIANEFRAIYERHSALRNEIEIRYGPNAPSRLPSKYGARSKPIRNMATVESDIAAQTAIRDSKTAKPSEKRKAERALDKLYAEANKLIEEESGRGLNPGKLVDKVASKFRSRGDLPDYLDKLKRQREGHINASDRAREYALIDLDRAMRKVYGRKPTPTNITQLRDVLEGKTPVTQLPAELQAPMKALREGDVGIDTLSDYMVQQGLVTGDLANTINTNRGKYTHYEYRAWNTPNWESVVQREKPAAVAKAKSEILAANHARWRAQGKSAAEIDQLVNGAFIRLVNKGEGIKSSMDFANAKLGHEDLGFLKKRKALPDWLREVWGQYEDPRAIFESSSRNASHYIINKKFLQTVEQVSLGKHFFKDPIEKGGERFTELLGNEAAFGELSKLYTTKEIKEAFQSAFEPRELSKTIRALLTLNSIDKYTKTLGNVPQGYVRNGTSNILLTVANGNINPVYVPQTLKLMGARVFNRASAATRKEDLRLVKYGVTGDSANYGEFRAAISDIVGHSQSIGDFHNNAMVRSLKYTGNTLKRWWAAIDDAFKVFNFYSEESKYRRAYPHWTPDQVARKAAELTTAQMPTYSRAPAAVQALRRIPFVAPFATFPSEIVRNTGNTIYQAAKEIRDPATRKIGLQRAAGLTAAIAAATALEQASQEYQGISEQEATDLRKFMPEYLKNAAIIWLDKDKDGNRKFVDTTYIAPHSVLTKPLKAAWDADTPLHKVEEFLKEGLEPYYSPELFPKRVYDVIKNDSPRIRNPQDTALGQFQDWGPYIGKAFEPGAVENTRRMYMGYTGEPTKTGQKYNLGDEAISTFTGVRKQRTNVTRSLTFAASRYANAKTDTTRLFTDTSGGYPTVSKAKLQADYDKAERIKNEQFKEIADLAGAAYRLGYSDVEIVDALMEGGVGQKEAFEILVGKRESNVFLPDEAAFRKALERGGNQRFLDSLDVLTGRR